MEIGLTAKANYIKRLIEIFTDPGDVVIDPVAGSASTLQAAYELERNAYGFEVNTKFYRAAMESMPCLCGSDEYEQMRFDMGGIANG